MQAHALTPRLVHAMAKSKQSGPVPGMGVEYPFLTMLVSGGHTLLLDSQSGIEHRILAETHDIAIGTCIDKAARVILPPEMLRMPYGKALEDFAFPKGASSYDYTPPKRRQDELERRRTRWGWAVGPPLADSNARNSSRRMMYSFGGLLTAVERFMQFERDSVGHVSVQKPRQPNAISIEERREMACEVQRVAFEHLASRIILHLTTIRDSGNNIPKTLVVSGGVASSRYLRHVLRNILDVRGFEDIALNFPPIELCTDNALMIAWAGYEMFLSGYSSQLDIGPLHKWSLDPKADDGGILGVGGYHPRRLEGPLLNLLEYVEPT